MANITALRHTVALMLSDDWKERFVAEYRQLQDRVHGLEKMLENWDKGQLNFKPNCPRYLLDDQLQAMKHYLGILERRSRIENIDLSI